MRWAVTSVVGVVLLTACFGGDKARVTTVTPSESESDIATPVEIMGSGFDCGVDQRFDSASLEVDWGFSARLGDTDLRDVVWLGSESLSALVPAGLPTGTFDLAVTRPDGRVLTLPAAFTVREPRAEDACAGGDVAVTSAAELYAAIVDANAAPGVQAICVAGAIALTTSIAVDEGILLYGTLDGELSGAALPAGSTGLVLSGGTSVIENLRFTDFAGGAVRVRDGALTVRRSVFSNCSPGVVSSAALDVIASRFIGGSAGVRTSGSGEGVISVRSNIFSKQGHGVHVSGATALTVDNNTFYRIESESVSAEKVSGVWLRNNVFQQYGGDALELSDSSMAKPATANALSREIACSSCGFDASNPVLDCGFADPEAGLFELSPTSPCVDRGVDVGLLFQGDAPDLGALELR